MSNQKYNFIQKQNSSKNLLEQSYQAVRLDPLGLEFILSNNGTVSDKRFNEKHLIDNCNETIFKNRCLKRVFSLQLNSSKITRTRLAKSLSLPNYEYKLQNRLVRSTYDYNENQPKNNWFYIIFILFTVVIFTLIITIIANFARF